MVIIFKQYIILSRLRTCYLKNEYGNVAIFP